MNSTSVAAHAEKGLAMESVEHSSLSSIDGSLLVAGQLLFLAGGRCICPRYTS